MDSARKAMLSACLDANEALGLAIRQLGQGEADIHLAERQVKTVHKYVRKAFMAYDSATQSELARKEGRA